MYCRFSWLHMDFSERYWMKTSEIHRVENADYKYTSRPLRSSSSNNLHPGFLIPASQARTGAALVLITQASTVWLKTAKCAKYYTPSENWLAQDWMDAIVFLQSAVWQEARRLGLVSRCPRKPQAIWKANMNNNRAYFSRHGTKYKGDSPLYFVPCRGGCGEPP